MHRRKSKQFIVDNYSNFDIRNTKFISYIELCLEDNEVDIVIVATPTKYHYSGTKAALEAGKHVLCEKPLSHTKTEIDELYEIAEKKEVVLLCAYNRRFDPQISKIKSQVKTKQIENQSLINTVIEIIQYPQTYKAKFRNISITVQFMILIL